jgi:4'-phosphopantetheinyl transferase
MNILITHADNKVQLQSHIYNNYLNQFPPLHRQQINRYRYREDAQACLFGKLLLLQCFDEMNLSKDLSSISYNTFKRPYLPDSSVDFNISHTKGSVVCAMSRDTKLGIDIEFVRAIDLSDFTDQFCDEEIDWITEGDRHTRFFDLWTRKEAVLKAVGTGLNIPLRSLNVLKMECGVLGQQVSLKKLDLFGEAVCHLATVGKVTEPIRIKKYVF